jgi:hypothetical protein
LKCEIAHATAKEIVILPGFLAHLRVRKSALMR